MENLKDKSYKTSGMCMCTINETVFNYKDIKEKVLEFENFLNNQYLDKKISDESHVIIGNKLREIFGDFEQE